MAETRNFIVACNCTVAYSGTIRVPADYTLEEAIEYAREHLKEVPIDSDLNYIGDTDELVEEYCEFAKEEE